LYTLRPDVTGSDEILPTLPKGGAVKMDVFNTDNIQKINEFLSIRKNPHIIESSENEMTKNG
jgi:hypothetical protein